MLTTTVFTACFQFVVWTVSCLYDLPVQSLHLPNTATGLGSGLPRCEQHRLPRIWVVLHASRVNLPACNPTANDHDIFDVLGHLLFKSSALTNWAIGPKNWSKFSSFCLINFAEIFSKVWKRCGSKFLQLRRCNSLISLREFQKQKYYNRLWVLCSNQLSYRP